MEGQTLIIQVKVTPTVQSKEITLPYYAKSHSGMVYYAIIGNGYAMNLEVQDFEHVSKRIGTCEISVLEVAHEQVNEDEFIAAHNRVLSVLTKKLHETCPSLQPELHDA